MSGKLSSGPERYYFSVKTKTLRNTKRFTFLLVVFFVFDRFGLVRSLLVLQGL